MKIDIRLESITKTIEIDNNCSYDELKKKIEKKFKKEKKEILNIGFTHILCYLYNKQFFYISNDEDVKKYIRNETPLLLLYYLNFVNDYSNCYSEYFSLDSDIENCQN